MGWRFSIHFGEVNQDSDISSLPWKAPALQDLFKIVKPEVILDFLKVAPLYILLWRACDCLKH